jgi:predicted KAP-like P-loop ATPase
MTRERNSTKIFPPELEVGELDGFDKNDLFGRAELGNRLMKLMERAEDPMVLALDAQWGTGKTVFLKKWAGLLRQNGFPVVHFDAFAADHAEDPFVAMSAEIIALAQEKQAASAPVKAFTDKAVEATKALAFGATRLAGRAAIRAATLNTLSAAEVGEELIGSTTSDAVGMADKEIKELLEGMRKRTFDAFRASLEELPALLSATDSSAQEKTNGDTTELRPLVSHCHCWNG